MKSRSNSLPRWGTALLAAAASIELEAASLKQATVTQAYNEVKVVAPSRGDRPAAAGEKIQGDQGLRTGQASRAELEFQDQTLTRLGANTIFNFENGTRDLSLEQGTMLLQVPKGAGGAKIRTAAITAAITGTSILLEYTPDFNPPPGSKKKKKKGYVKVIVLEGTLRLYLNNRVGESVLLGPGQMLITTPDALQLPQSVDVDLLRLVDSSILVNNRYWQGGRETAGARVRGTAQTGALAMPLIDQEIARQRALIANGTLAETNLGITGRGTIVMIRSDDILNQINTRTTVAQSQVISSGPPINPGNYTIGSATTIKTVPPRQTGGTPATGAVYFGATSDGPFARFGFSAARPFDTTAGFAGSFFGGGNFPSDGVAVFRYGGTLTLAGNVTFDLTGGRDSVALIAGAGITTATTPFTFDLGGLSELLLATVNGPITIGAGATITGGSTRLDLYARGISSDLTMNGTIALGEGDLFAAAERDAFLNGSISALDVRVVTGRSLFLNGSINSEFFSAHADQDIDVQAGATLQSFGSIILDAGGNLTVSGSLRSSVIKLSAGGLLTFGGANLDLMQLTSLTASGGSLRLTSNLALGANTVASLTSANGIDATGFTISGAQLTLNITGGALNAAAINVPVLNASNATFNAAVTAGTFNANGGTVTVAGTAPFTNAGSVNVNAGTLIFNAPYVQTTGTLALLGGGVQSPTRLDLQGGFLVGSGSIAADILNNATINPALGGNGFNVTGNVSLLSGSQLIFQIGGLAQGSQYGFINVNGSMVLGGNLVVMFVNGFQNSVTNGNTFTLISTSGGLSGAFANVLSGSRVTLTGSVGSFLVTYIGGTLVLSDYRLATAATWLGGAGVWSNPAQWSTNPLFPNNGNGGQNFDVIFNGGTITQDIAAGVVIDQLQMTAGTLNLSNPLTLNAGLQFSGGSINGGTLNIAGVSNQSATMTVSALTINNSGTYNLTLDNSNIFSGGATFNNSGTLAKTTGPGVDTFNNVLNNNGTVTVQNGTLSLTGGGGGTGTFDASAGATLLLASNFSLGSGSQLTGAGTIVMTNNTTTTLVGTITNTGNVVLNSTGSFTDLVLGGDVTLAGGGVISLQNAARVRGAGILTNAGNTLQGETSNSGSLGANQIGIVNLASGIIDANVAGLALNLDPSSADGLLNQGLLRASNGGLLLLNGSGGGVFDNTGGIILALNGSQVQLANGAVVIGGTLSTAGSGTIATLNTATLNTLTNIGNFVGNNGSNTTLVGTITNNGTMALNSAGSFTDFVLSGNVTLAGGGVISMVNAGRFLGSGILTNAGNTIQGETSNSGSLGANQIGIINQSLIDANQLNLIFDVDPNSLNGLMNTGTMRASNGGILQLNGNGGGVFNNTGGLITALNGSEVRLVNSANITGGTLSTAGTGLIRNANNATLTTLTNAGNFVGNNGSRTDLIGTITNTGSIFLNSVGSFTDLFVNGSVTLNGGGVVTLANADRILGSGVLINFNNLIQGETSNSGSLGANQIGIVNQVGGIIDANVSGLALNVDPSSADSLLNQGLMRASGGGILLLNGSGGGAFFNSNLISALTGSEVQLVNNVLVDGGTFSTTGTGVIRNLNTATLQNLTIAGAFVANNGSTTTLLGTITNSGTININSVGSFTDVTLGGFLTLNGGGVVTLSNADRIFGGGVLINVNNLIQGETNNSGSLGANQIGIVNQVGGIIDANVSGLALNVDPSSADSLLNQGIMRASNGGILLLNGSGGGKFVNASTISALDASEVRLANGVLVQGGTFLTMGTGVIRNVNTATLEALTIAGSFVANNGTTTTLIGPITNSGTMNINSVGSFTDLVISGNVTLTGGGILQLSSADRVFGGGGFLTNAANTIQGETNNGGSLGADQIGISNLALINANVAGLVLDVDPGSAGLTNTATMQASGGGILRLNGSGLGGFDNTGGLIAALAGSEVQLTNFAIVSGGTLSTSGGGIIRNLNSATLSSLTLAGSFVANNGTNTTLTGTINNLGSININSTGSFTDLFLNGNVTLTGNGTLILSSADRVSGSGILTNAGNTIQGETSNSGSLGTNQIGIVNQAGGIIDANVVGEPLVIDPSAGGNLLNQGLMRASNGGLLVLDGNGGGTFTNTGTIQSVGGGRLLFNGTVNSSGLVDVADGALTATGTYTQTAGTFQIAGGTVQSNNALNFQGGLLTGTGTITADIVNSAMIRPALGGGGLTITGNLSLLAGSQLSFQLGGLAQASQYGFIGVNGAVTLGGSLVVSFVNGFQNSVTNGDTFTLLTTSSAFSGAFANVASGGTLTIGGFGTFVVTYSGNTLILSNFTTSAPANAVWDGTSNNWSNAAHWTTNPAFPNGNFNATINAGTVTLDGAFSVVNLTLAGGILSGTAPNGLFLAGPASSWTGGTMSAPLTISLGAVLDIVGSGSRDFSAGFFVNNGVVNRGNSGDFLGRTTSGVTNNATWNEISSANTQYSLPFGDPGPWTFTNSSGATFTKTTASTLTFISVLFDNAGSVLASAGTLSLGAGTSSGTFTAVGATINLAGQTLNSGVTLNASSGGVINFSGGSVNGTLNTSALGVNYTGGDAGGSFTLFGVLNWSAGSWNSAGTTTVAAGSTLNLSGSGDRQFDAHTFMNNGIVNRGNSGDFLGRATSGGVTNNGTWNETSSANSQYGLPFGDPGPWTFANISGATFTKSTASTLTFSGVRFDNAGSVLATAGTLNLGAGSSAGTFTATGATINLSGHTLNAGVTLNTSSGGAINFFGGSVNGILNTSATGVNYIGGDAGGSFTLVGALNWSAGSWNSAGTTTVSAGSTLNLSGSGDRQFDAHTFVNNGIVNRGNSGDFLGRATSGGVTNNGTWNEISPSNTQYSLPFGDPGPWIFANAAGATFTKSTASTLTLNGVVFNNAGSVVATAGTLGIGAGTSAGTFTANGATINLSGHTLNAGVTLTAVSGGTINFFGGSVNGILNTSASGVSYTGGDAGGSFTLFGALNWSAGSWNSAGTTTVAAGSTLNISGSGNRQFDAHTLVNNGIVNRGNSGDLVGRLTSAVTNNGTWNETSTANTQYGLEFGDPGPWTFVNSAGATFTKSTASTLTFSGVVFNNAGAVTVNAGSIAFNSGYTQTAGTLNLAGGNISSSTVLNLQGGLLTGAGNIAASIMNNAMIQPALAGTGLAVTGNVSLLSGSQLSFQLGGLTQGSQYGFISVNGAVTLGGNLVVSFANGFENSVTGANTFTLMTTTGALSGAFLNVASGGTLVVGSIGSFVVTYGSGTLTLSGFVPSGAPGTWIGTTGNWSVSSNWSNNTVPNSAGLDVFIDNGRTGTNSVVTLDITVNVRNLTIDAGDRLTILNGAQLTLNGTMLTDNGQITINAGGGHLNLASGTLITGNGTLALVGGTSQLNGAGTITQDVGHTLQGSGVVSGSFVNNGTVDANIGTLNFSGGFTQNAGVLGLNSSIVQSPTPFQINGGLLTGFGILSGSVNNGATILPLFGSGGLAITGALNLSTPSTLIFNLGGTILGTQYGLINVSGAVALAGVLNAQFIGGFETTVTNAATFGVLRAGSPLTGVFSNVASGARLATSDGFGSFLVTYSGTQVILSDYLANITNLLTANWLSAANGNWTTGSNWSTPNFPNDATPANGTGYNVVIAAAGAPYTVALATPIRVQNVTLNSANSTLSLNNGASLRVLGATNLQAGTLFFNGGMLRDGTLNISGGSAAFASNANNQLDNVLVTGNLSFGIAGGFLSLVNGTQVNGTVDLTATSTVVTLASGAMINGAVNVTGSSSQLRLNYTTTFSGQTISLGSASTSGQILLSTGTTLTLGSGELVHGTGTIGNVGAGTMVINQGTISADLGLLTISPAVFSNQGTMSVTNGATLTISSTNWSNSGTITVNASTLNLDGNFATSSLAGITRTGGTVNLNGTLNNTGATMTLTPALGVLNLNSGTIQNGTIDNSSGQVLTFANTASNILDNVVVNGGLTIATTGFVNLSNGTQINGTVDLSGNSAHITLNTGTAINGTVNLSGSGSSLTWSFTTTLDGRQINLGTASTAGSLNVGSGTTLTLGSAEVVRGSGIINGASATLINQGAINADLAGQTLTIQPVNFTNQGALSATNGATLTIGSTNWSNSGTITMNASTLNLDGNFATSSLAGITRTGGTVNLSGTLNNTGATLTLTPTLGVLNLSGGTIQNGTIDNSSGQVLTFITSASNILDNVVVNGGLSMANNGFVNLSNGTQINGTVDLSGNSAHITLNTGTAINGTVNLSGSGSSLTWSFTTTLDGRQINLGSASAGASLNVGNGTTLTLGSAEVVRGSGVINGASATLINQGAINADLAGQTLTIQPTNFTNQGALSATNGATLTIGSTNWSNSGTITMNASTLNLNGNFATSSLVGITRTGGTVNLTGTLNNTGATLTLTPALGVLNLSGGTIQNGTIDNSSGQVLTFINSASNILDNVVINGGLSMATAGFVNLSNGTQINGTVDLLGNAAHITLNTGTAINGTVNLSGSGSSLSWSFTTTLDGRQINLGSASTGGSLNMTSGTTLTLGSAEVVRGSGLINGASATLINQGAINADLAGQTLTIQPTNFTNQGALSATNGATLTISSTNWSNSGTITMNASTLNLNSNFATSSLAGITRTGGTVNLNGALNNTGATLTLTPALGVLNLSGGTIQNGTIDNSSGQVLTFINSASNVLDNVVVNGGLSMATSGFVNLSNGTQVNGTVDLLGNAAHITLNTGTAINGTVNLSGSGSSLTWSFTTTLDGRQINLGSASTGGSLNMTSGTTLTLGSAEVVRGSGLINGASATLINQGAINADLAGQTLTMNASTFLNTGTMTVTNGATLTLNNTWNNSGTIQNVGTSTLRFNGTGSSSGTVNVGSGSLIVGASSTFTQTAGNFQVAGGSVTSTNALNIQGGMLNGWGGITANVNMTAATLQPMANPAAAALAITGNLSLTSASFLSFQLGGITPRTEFGVLTVSGAIALGGSQLLVSFSGFTPSGGDTFTLATTAGGFSGSFSNVSNGGTLTIAGGSFTVTYSGSNLVLSNFVAGRPAVRSIVISSTAPSDSAEGGTSSTGGTIATGRNVPGRLGPHGRVIVSETPHLPGPRIPRVGGAGVPIQTTSQLRALLSATVVAPGSRKAIVSREALVRARGQDHSAANRSAADRRANDAQRLRPGGAGESRRIEDATRGMPRTADALPISAEPPRALVR